MYLVGMANASVVFFALFILISINHSVVSGRSNFEYNTIRLKRQTIAPFPEKTSTSNQRAESDATLVMESSTAQPIDNSTSDTLLLPVTSARPLLCGNDTSQHTDQESLFLPQPTQVSEPIISTTNLGEVIDSTDESSDTSYSETFLVKEENFRFYKSSIYVDMNRTKMEWDNVKNMPANSLLSQSGPNAYVTVPLSFEFPFYGHLLSNVTVVTGGFVYTGNKNTSWLAATQYIAPLMGNFGTNISNDAFVKLYDNGTCFTALWENVSLLDNQGIGNFTFSVSLHKTGQIVFTYFSIPTDVCDILDYKHPINSGLSDAYAIVTAIVFIKPKQRIVYEYDRVRFGCDITNNTINSLTANPTCHSFTDCASCVQGLQDELHEKCTWCSSMQKCSTGLDRNHQEWKQRGCEKLKIREESACPR